MVQVHLGVLKLFNQRGSLESDNPDIQGLYDIVENWWKSCYHQAQGNSIDMIAYSCGWMPLEIGEEMRVHFNEKAYIIKRVEDA